MYKKKIEKTLQLFLKSTELKNNTVFRAESDVEEVFNLFNILEIEYVMVGQVGGVQIAVFMDWEYNPILRVGIRYDGEVSCWIIDQKEDK